MTAFPRAELDELLELAPKHVRVTLTSAQLLDCNSNPVVLLAAPGAGLVHVVERAVVKNVFDTGAYAYTTIANISYTDESGAPIIAMVALFLETVATALASLPSTLLTGAAAATRPVANAPVVFSTPDADPTTGAGTMVIDLWYRTVAA